MFLAGACAGASKRAIVSWQRDGSGRCPPFGRSDFTAKSEEIQEIASDDDYFVGYRICMRCPHEPLLCATLVPATVRYYSLIAIGS